MIVSQLDIPLESLVPESYWQSKEKLFHPLTLPLAKDTAAGHYRVVAGMYDTQSGARLPLYADPTEQGRGDVSNELYLVTFRLTEEYHTTCENPYYREQ